ncbi:MAG: adenosylcobinamide-phosphate synthase CbiB [Desulfatiglandales bacterium]
MSSLFLLVAFVLDLIIGDPRVRYHPVRLMGGLIGLLERGLFKEGQNQFLGGIVLGLGSLLIVLVLNTAIYKVFGLIHPFLPNIWSILIITMLIAVKDLMEHVMGVVKRVERGDLEGAREVLSLIVGRDTKVLDQHGVLRAIIETLSENFVDGILSPIFWFWMGALLGKCMGLDHNLWGINMMLLYKVTNTLDSMVGYRNERYERFGKFSAKLDDLLNFIPARLSPLFLLLGAHTCSFDWRKGLSVLRRDMLKHQSPNSAHAESFVAGALGISLGGPTVYEGHVKERAFIGDGPSQFGIEKVYGAILMIFVSTLFVIGSAFFALWFAS